MRQASEQALRVHNDRHDALYEFTNRLYRAERESERYDAALDAIQQALHTGRASILLHDHINVMRFVAWRGLSDAYRRAVDGHSPWTLAVKDPQPITISNIADADLPATLREVIGTERIAALAFIPLLADGRLVGKFMVYYEQPHVFSDIELDLAVTIARQLGFSIERRRADEARLASEQELRELTHSLESQVAERTRERDRIWQVADDLLGVGNFEGYFLSINPAWTSRLGWSEREIRSMHVRDLRHPDDESASAQAHAELKGSGRPTVRLENRFRHKDGSWRWIHWTMTAQDGLIYVIGKDITEEKSASEILRESERQFRLLVSGVVDYALYMLDRQGKVASWNVGAERIKGYSAREVIGEHFSRFYTEEDRATRLPWRALAIAEREGRYEAEGWRMRKDGSRFWASVVIDAIRDENGELAGFAKITRDITERREAQLKLEETQRQLAHAQKMEALGQLTGGVAHDFNNMLMVIAGQAASLRDRLTEQKDMRSIRAIELAAQRGETLTRQLLAFSRRQTLNPIPIRLQDRIEELRDVLRSSAREDIRLLISIPDDIWPIAVDVAELQLALVNIVVNARDAMPQGGNITIVAENRNVPAGTLAGELVGEFVAIHLSDTGTGIPEDVLPRIFEPFFTTKQSARGTGLGLAQVYGFASQSGGTVTIASKIGRGTTVTLYLPRTHRQVVEEDRAPEIVRGSNETVLLVEDNMQVNDVTAELLENLGYRVLSTDSAAAAVDVLKAEPSIALVFSDVVLPGELDGFGLARKVRQEYPHIPVLLATGYAQSRSPSNEFPILRKPYQLAQLAVAIRSAMGAETKRRSTAAQDGDGDRPRVN